MRAPDVNGTEQQSDVEIESHTPESLSGTALTPHLSEALPTGLVIKRTKLF